MPEADCRPFAPGDLYEDAFGHPCFCVEANVAEDELWGISLIDGTCPRSTSISHDGVRKLSIKEAWDIKRQFMPPGSTLKGMTID